MASEHENVAAARPAYEGAGNVSTTSRFVVRETALHWDVAVYRRLYLNMLDARCFGVRFSDGRSFTMFDRMEARRDTDIGT